MSGMQDIFDLAVVIEAVDKFTGPMKSIESAVATADARMKTIGKTMKAFGSSASEIKKVEDALKGLQVEDNFAKMASDLERIGKTQGEIDALKRSYAGLVAEQEKYAAIHESMAKWGKVALTGAGITGGGLVLGDVLVKSLEQAGEFQTKLVTIQDVTGATTKQMDSLGNSIMNTSTKVSKFNDMQLAGFAQQLATGGFNNVKDVQSLMLPVSQFAEAQVYEGKNSDASSAVNQAIEMAHMFGHYDPKSFSSFLNQFNKYSNMEPGDSSQLYQTLTYLAPIATKQMHMSQSDTMALAAVANRIGLTGSHGGTNAADMILRLIPGLIGGKPTYDSKTGKWKIPNAWKGMQDLGLVDANGNSPFFKNGQITNLSAMLNILTNAAKTKTPEQLTTDYKEIFGIQGGRAASILSNPQTIEQLAKMQAQLGQTKSMEQIQQDISKTPEGQLNMLKSNAMTAQLRFAQALGPLLNPLLVKVNALLSSFLKLEQTHPGLMKLVGVFAVMLTGALLVAGPLTSLIGLFGMAANGLRLIGVASKFGTMLKEFKDLGGAAKFLVKDWGIFGGTLKIVTRSVGIFASWIGRVTGLTKIWSGVTAVFDAIMDANPIVLIIIAIIALVAAIILVITHWKQVIAVIKEVWAWIKQFVSDIGKLFANLWKEGVDAGANLIKGLWQGITNFSGWFKGKISSFVSDHIVGPFKHLLGIHSPSTVFEQHGMYIVQGLAQGINNNSGLAEKASTDLAKRTMAGASSYGTSGANALASQPVIINVYASPGQDEEAIADAVVRKLGKQSRKATMSTGTRLNIQSMR